MSAGIQLRVLTWNVHGCVGRDGACDPQRVARVLEAVQPDISALQEIDARLAKALELDPFRYFADRFGWGSLDARTLSSEDGHYGHVLLSRWPIRTLGDLDLSVPRSEPRKAIFGSIDAPFARITVVAAHLGLLWGHRRVQLARLQARISTLGERPILIMGDFNDVRRRGPAERSFCPPLEPAPAPGTFPSRWPILPLDRIWYSKPLELVSIATLREADRVSDHLPLLASFRMA